jgi:hypothetical protein
MTIGIGTREGSPIYVSDLPGHDGLTPSSKSTDWGWSPDVDKAIELSPYWHHMFEEYSRAGYGFHGRLQKDADFRIEPKIELSQVSANARYIAGRIVMHLWILLFFIPVFIGLMYLLVAVRGGR